MAEGPLLACIGLHGAWVVLAASAGVTVGNLLAGFLRWRHDARVRELFRRRLEDAGRQR